MPDEEIAKGWSAPPDLRAVAAELERASTEIVTEFVELTRAIAAALEAHLKEPRP